MEKEGGNRERMRKCRESISLHFLIFSPFSPHFLILSPFPCSPAARLQRFVQPWFIVYLKCDCYKYHYCNCSHYPHPLCFCPHGPHCPADQDSGQCTCEYVEPGQRVCSTLIEVDNPGVDQVRQTFQPGLENLLQIYTY